MHPVGVKRLDQRIIEKNFPSEDKSKQVSKNWTEKHITSKCSTIPVLMNLFKDKPSVFVVETAIISLII